jgi:glutamine synthetase
MLMAGLDGIKNKIDPRKLGYGPVDRNVYDLSDEEKKDIRSVPGSLDEALDALQADYEFLTAGGVFTKEFIDNYVDYKRGETKAVSIRVHPHEYSLYFDC